MKPKFKIGAEVFFMRYDEPSKGTIKGIAVIEGEFEEINFKRTGTKEEPSINYSMQGTYTSIEEHKVFSTKEQLQISLFSKL